MFANRISSSTSCSIWLPETSPPSSARGLLRHRFQSCNTSLFRTGPGHNRNDDRKLSLATDLEPDATVPLYQDRVTARRVHGRLVVAAIAHLDRRLMQQDKFSRTMLPE